MCFSMVSWHAGVNYTTSAENIHNLLFNLIHIFWRKKNTIETMFIWKVTMWYIDFSCCQYFAVDIYLTKILLPFYRPCIIVSWHFCHFWPFFRKLHIWAFQIVWVISYGFDCVYSRNLVLRTDKTSHSCASLLITSIGFYCKCEYDMKIIWVWAPIDMQSCQKNVGHLSNVHCLYRNGCQYFSNRAALFLKISLIVKTEKAIEKELKT